MNRISLIGFGTWGKALLKIVAKAQKHYEIIVYTRQQRNLVENSVKEINEMHNIVITNNLSFALDSSDVSIIATKAQDVSDVVSEVKRLNKKFANCVITSKGFSANGALLSDILIDVVQDDIAVLSGPNFASEILTEKLSISTIASKNAMKFKNIFESPNFRIETCNDVIGVQVCGILKNIFAIGCGAVSGAFNSDNTKAAFMTKAFNELMYTIEFFGGRKETAFTTAGIGDLILTCYSKNSRNHEFGYKLATHSINNAIVTVEGYSSLIVLTKLLNHKMPLCKAIHDLINKSISIKEFGEIILN